jgi:aarF domain-containing kinase
VPSDALLAPSPDSAALELEPAPTKTLTASKVPSSRIARLFHYGGPLVLLSPPPPALTSPAGLAASLSYGAASELVRRSASGADAPSGPLLLSEANAARLVAKLTRMRGAALKLGQFLSIQDTHTLPPQVEEIFRRVQDAAHYMPDWQLEVPPAVSLRSRRALTARSKC